MSEIGAAVSTIVEGVLDAGEGISGMISNVVKDKIGNDGQTQEHHQLSKPGHEGALCGTTGTRCRRGLVCSPVQDPKNTITAAYNNGMCTDWKKAREFDETCDSTGVLHCDPKWACLDAEDYDFGREVDRVFKGQTKRLKRCGFCTDDHDCVGERWCGATEAGAQKMCQTGARPQRRTVASCASKFVFNNEEYTGNSCVKWPKLWGPDLRLHSWCPTEVDHELVYTERLGKPTEWPLTLQRKSYRNILLCTDQHRHPR